MWRPDNWNNPYLKSDVPEWEEIRKAYEAGADAILEALIKKGEHIEPYQTFEEYPNVSGTYTFIPDEKK